METTGGSLHGGGSGCALSLPEFLSLTLQTAAPQTTIKATTVTMVEVVASSFSSGCRTTQFVVPPWSTGSDTIVCAKEPIAAHSAASAAGPCPTIS